MELEGKQRSSSTPIVDHYQEGRDFIELKNCTLRITID